MSTRPMTIAALESHLRAERKNLRWLTETTELAIASYRASSAEYARSWLPVLRRSYETWPFEAIPASTCSELELVTEIFEFARSFSLHVDHNTAWRDALSANSPILSKVATISIRGQTDGDELVRELSSSPHLSNLRHLHLVKNNISTAGILQIAKTGAFHGITSLKLDGNTLGDHGLAALTNSTHLKDLTRLSCWQCEVGEGGV